MGGRIVVLLLLACGSALGAPSQHHLVMGSFVQKIGNTEGAPAPAEDVTVPEDFGEEEGVTPVQEVIKLLENLKKEVEEEGKAEAEAYNKYACFCKDTTLSKSTAIKDGQTNIESLSATLEEKTALKNEKIQELGERKKKQEELAATLKATETQFAVYNEVSADLNKAISSLNKAIKALEDSKPAAAAFLQGVSSNLQQMLVVADAMGIAPQGAKRKTLGIFLQKAASGKVDPEDPEYKFHSQGIIDVLNELLDDFTKNKEEVDAEFAKTKKTYEDTVADLTTQMDENETAMKQLQSDIETLTTEIATARSDLVNAEAQLKDDELYMTDLTAQCEARAHDWDQRAKMRADEDEALSQALTILTGKVESAAESVNVRALLLQNKTVGVKPHVPDAATSDSKLVSFIQEEAKAHSALRGMSQQVRKQRAIELLRSAGKRLGSASLVTVAMHVAADPFAKVKTLIQNLIERLLREATEEATKKGFCDTELGKAKKDRDYRWEETKKLSTEISALEAKNDTLVIEIDELGEQIDGLTDNLNQSTVMRAEDKEANMMTVKEAKEGLEAVTKALTILKAFYKQAAKAEVLLQASPVDEDTSGPGFSSAYKGKQQGAKAIIGLLETIKSDFERTIKKTNEMEEAAHR